MGSGFWCPHWLPDVGFLSDGLALLAVEEDKRLSRYGVDSEHDSDK